jgi:hypothetical protein
LDKRKTKFVIYVAGHLTDLYSNNKIQNLKSDTSIKISWEDNSSDLIDVSGDTIDVPPQIKD